MSLILIPPRHASKLLDPPMRIHISRWHLDRTRPTPPPPAARPSCRAAFRPPRPRPGPAGERPAPTPAEASLPPSRRPRAAGRRTGPPAAVPRASCPRPSLTATATAAEPAICAATAIETNAEDLASDACSIGPAGPGPSHPDATAPARRPGPPGPDVAGDDQGDELVAGDRRGPRRLESHAADRSKPESDRSESHI